MESGGDLLRGDAMVTDSIHILHASIDCRQQLWCVQASEGLLGDPQRTE
jgi:hypothetical protein